MIANELATDLPWDAPPLSFLNADQQVQFKQAATVRRFSLGDMLWSTDHPGRQILVISGKVRLVPEDGQSVMLNKGDWLGDRLDLPGFWKARAADKNVVIAEWTVDLWDHVFSGELERFWALQRNRCLPKTADTPQPISGFPFVAGVNTAAACLTMAASHLQIPAQMEWVQRQLRGQRATEVVEAAEKLGLQLRQLDTAWNNLRQLGLPALMQWRDESATTNASVLVLPNSAHTNGSSIAATGSTHWVIAYAVKGDRLIVADRP
jgi:Peptidase C39 family